MDVEGGNIAQEIRIFWHAVKRTIFQGLLMNPATELVNRSVTDHK